MINGRVYSFDSKDPTNGTWYTLNEAYCEGMIEFCDEGLKPTDESSALVKATTLKDKNGVEIYEGDLIGNGKSEENGAVYYCEKEAGFFINSNGFDFCLTEMDASDSVIGNIYQNPELLEAGL
jgi:uncharacterized phage protein (TIGR01671 family)